MSESAVPLVRVENLRKHFAGGSGSLRRGGRTVRAVDGISFDIHRGETLGLVGESGCGKSTTARVLLRLLEATSGTVQFDGTDIGELDPTGLRLARKRMQMIFQDPYSSLNPRATVGSIVREPLEIHRLGDRDERDARVASLLEMVGLSPHDADRYPHEFSGGQRQRVGIARALATNPEFLVADEPIAALDVSIQAQVVNLLNDLKRDLGLTYLFIAHDLSMVRYISDRVAVMYLGQLVEVGTCDDVFERTLHPYTKALMSAIPVPDPQREARRKPIILHGDVPSPANPPSGCRFHPRCPIATALCESDDPPSRNLGSAGSDHWVSCHHAEEGPLQRFDAK